ncbi:MAG: diacylglycerol kinase family lipid kinase [Clostridia bacterium]
MKHVILVNPISGNKRGEKYAIIVQKLLKKNSIDSVIYISTYPKHITKIVRELAIKQECRFYSIGGDGTLNEVVTAIINTNSDIVVIPAGTGNDFVKSVSKYMSIRKIINGSINTKSTKTDVIKLDNEHYCINILNAGFDALVAKNVEKFKSIPLISGKMKYNLSIFFTLLSAKNYNFKLRCDNKIFKNKFTLIAIANGKYYGGGICPCPQACINDNTLNICAISKTNTLEKIIFLPKYKKGKHLNLKHVHMIDAQNISLVSDKRFPLSIDGEIIFTNKLKAKILHAAINIVHIN